MRPTLRTPSARRARQWGRGLATLGDFVGTVAGSLPIGVKRKQRKPALRKLVVPITGGAAIVGVLARRRRSSGSTADTGFSPSPSTTDSGFSPSPSAADADTSFTPSPSAGTGPGPSSTAADTGFGPSPSSAEPSAATGVEGGAPQPVAAPSVTAPPVDPPLPTDAADTATEQARIEAIDGPGVEGVVETPRDAAGETPGSSALGEKSGS